MTPFYHATPSRNLARILDAGDGLIPGLGSRASDLGEDQPAVFLFRDLESLEDAMSNWLGEAFDEDDEIAVLEVALPEDVRLGAGAADFEVACLDPIPAASINLLRLE